jgi:NADP-dependent 3-hydroxy acid dehydrogenase YdfG
MVETRSLQDTVVVITGASSGVGAATAKLLASQGANVVLGARRKDRLEKLCAEIGTDRALAVPMDVSSAADNRRLVEAAVERFGKLDSLVANAGIGGYGGILDYSDDELAEMIDVNFAGTVWSIRAAVPFMQERGGDIVVVASVAGLRGGANEAVYAATKFAQVGLAGAVDRELRDKGIRVTTICPAATATEFAMGRGRTPDMPQLADWMTGDDVASAISFTLAQPRRFRTTQWHLWSAAEGS